MITPRGSQLAAPWCLSDDTSPMSFSVAVGAVCHEVVRVLEVWVVALMCRKVSYNQHVSRYTIALEIYFMFYMKKK